VRAPQPVRPKKHNSVKRLAPRVFLRPPSLGESPEVYEASLARNVDPASGHLTYRQSGPGFCVTWSKSQKRNRRLITARYGSVGDRIRSIIDLEYRIACRFVFIPGAISDALPNDAEHVIVRTFAQTLVSLHSALDLTFCGLYAAARPLLRQAYEGLMIAKLCSLDPMSDAYDLWLDDGHVGFTRHVLERIATPSKESFDHLWKALSGATHALSSAGQPDLDNAAAVERAPLNLIWIQMLLEANYHLFTAHFLTPTIRYYQRAWFPEKRLARDRHVLRELLAVGRRSPMGDEGRLFIRHYKARWQLR
jgi:hypothetical protein